jgi:hypothetical protein
MGLGQDVFKVKKPHDQLVEQMLKTNYIRLDRRTDWSSWNYLAKIRNNTNMKLWEFQMPHGTNQVFVIKRPVHIEKVDEGGKYSWFKIRRN